MQQQKSPAYRNRAIKHKLKNREVLPADLPPAKTLLTQQQVQQKQPCGSFFLRTLLYRQQ